MEQAQLVSLEVVAQGMALTVEGRLVAQSHPGLCLKELVSRARDCSYHVELGTKRRFLYNLFKIPVKWKKWNTKDTHFR